MSARVIYICAKSWNYAYLVLQWSGRTEQLHQQLNRDIVKIIFKLVWKWMETKKFKQQFITFLVAIRSKYVFDIDWPVPSKTYRKKSQFWWILDLLGSSWPLEKCWYECPTFRFEANNLWESLHGLTNRSTWIMQIEPEPGQHPSQWRHGSSWNIQLLFLRTWTTLGFCWGRHWSAVNYLLSASCTPHWFRSTRPLMHGR